MAYRHISTYWDMIWSSQGSWDGRLWAVGDVLWRKLGLFCFDPQSHLSAVTILCKRKECWPRLVGRTPLEKSPIWGPIGGCRAKVHTRETSWDLEDDAHCKLEPWFSQESHLGFRFHTQGAHHFLAHVLCHVGCDRTSTIFDHKKLLRQKLLKRLTLWPSRIGRPTVWLFLVLLLEIPSKLGEPAKCSRNITDSMTNPNDPKAPRFFGFLLSSAHHLQPWRHFERHLQGNEFGRLRQASCIDGPLNQALIK